MCQGDRCASNRRIPSCPWHAKAGCQKQWKSPDLVVYILHTGSTHVPLSNDTDESWLLAILLFASVARWLKNATKSHSTELLYPYICICYVFHVGIDSKVYSKIHGQNMYTEVIKYGFATRDGTKICTVWLLKVFQSPELLTIAVLFGLLHSGSRKLQR